MVSKVTSTPTSRRLLYFTKCNVVAAYWCSLIILNVMHHFFSNKRSFIFYRWAKFFRPRLLSVITAFIMISKYFQRVYCCITLIQIVFVYIRNILKLFGEFLENLKHNCICYDIYYYCVCYWSHSSKNNISIPHSPL